MHKLSEKRAKSGNFKAEITLRYYIKRYQIYQTLYLKRKTCLLISNQAKKCFINKCKNGFTFLKKLKTRILINIPFDRNIQLLMNYYINFENKSKALLTDVERKISSFKSFSHKLHSNLQTVEQNIVPVKWGIIGNF